MRLKVVAAVAQLSPPPAVPDEVYLHEGAAEYVAAIRLAPWLTADYFNLGVVLEKAGNREQAIRYLKLYLQLAPNAADAPEVKKRIGGMQFDLANAAQQSQKRQQYAPLAGIYQDSSADRRCRVSIDGEAITIETIAFKNYMDDQWWPIPDPVFEGVWKGTIVDGRIGGTFAHNNGPYQVEGYNYGWSNGYAYQPVSAARSIWPGAASSCAPNG